jgi:hypothetical protein
MKGDRGGGTGRAGHRRRVEINVEVLFAEPAGGGGGRLGLDLGVGAKPLQALKVVAAAVGRIPIDRQPLPLVAGRLAGRDRLVGGSVSVLVGVGELREQLAGHLGVAGIGRS